MEKGFQILIKRQDGQKMSIDSKTIDTAWSYK